MSEPIFRIYDNELKCWAGEFGGRGLDKYALEDFKESQLIYCDMEGFMIAPDGSLTLHDECGNFVYCDTSRFQICFPKEYVKTLVDSPTGNYLIEPTKAAPAAPNHNHKEDL